MLTLLLLYRNIRKEFVLETRQDNIKLSIFALVLIYNLSQKSLELNIHIDKIEMLDELCLGWQGCLVQYTLQDHPKVLRIMTSKTHLHVEWTLVYHQ